MAAQMEIRNITRSASCKLTKSSFTDELFNVDNNKANEVSKKACLCSPTTHAGSFRCRRHRLVPNKNSLSTASLDNSNNNCKRWKEDHGSQGNQPCLWEVDAATKG